ncbi:MAG TPA: carboxypeptidase-like regulatory domain-containing protein [Terriglobales bacterium]|nr:carboxypeptidase-like regulatory domain-containing protein [Terriglobales bacterium]
MALLLPLLLLMPLGIAGYRAAGGEKPKAEPPPYALIFGTVWDPDGHPVYGVTVKVRRADDKDAKKTRWETFSNHTGEFAQRVPMAKADYIVWADLKGFKLPPGKKLKAAAEVPVHIEGDLNERVDIGLHLDW